MDLCPGLEANVGQWPDGVRFLARSGSALLMLTAEEAFFALGAPPVPKVRLLPLGTKPGARLGGRKRMLARANYFIGDDPVCWRTGVPRFASVAYESLFPERTRGRAH